MARGGLCGINVHSKFLSEPDDLGAGQKEQLLRLIDRMLELGGEDVIAWGMDLDGGVTCIRPLEHLTEGQLMGNTW